MIVLYAFSQIGLTIYMFLVGLEFDTQLFREQARRAGLISLAGVVVPFVLGAVTAPLLFHQSGLFGAGVTLWMATLFFGAALCITAFPILARILQEREIAGTRLGTLLLAAASIDDAVVWCLLAVVLASFKSSAWIALLAIVGGTLYVVGMLTLGRSTLRFFVRYTEHTARRSEHDGGMTKRTLAVVLLMLMLCAWFTTRIGLYEVFGAFIAGGCATERPGSENSPTTRTFDRISPVTCFFCLFRSQYSTRVDQHADTLACYGVDYSRCLCWQRWSLSPISSHCR
jgi:Kef-type K+ transport system membrane component KefB